MIAKTAKRLSALAFALMLIFGSVTVCFAQSVTNSQYSIEDSKNLLTENEFEQAKQKLEDASKKTGWQFIVFLDPEKVVFNDSLKDYYEENYYNKKDFSKNSVVLVINAALNKGTFFANGDASAYVDDGRINEAGVKLRADLNDQNFSGAIGDFADKMVKFHDTPTAEAEKRDGKLGYVLKHYWWAFALIALIAGGATFGITAGKYKYNGKYNTYNLSENSQTNLSEKQDIFVTKHTTSRVIQQSSSSSGSGGSGSSGGSRGGDF